MTEHDPARADKADEMFLEDPSPLSPRYEARPSSEIERISTSTSTSSRRRISMSRIPTQHEDPETLERIATHKSQHDETVGRRISTRRSSLRRKSKPLPAFGAGKPYPPMLPAQDTYVVEFDGPDDPMHAQNWPLKKK